MKVRSKKPTKQRNAIRHPKNHQLSRLFTAPLSKDLQEEWGVKRMPLRKDDTVRVMKGDFVDIEGKVIEKNSHSLTITIEECTVEKRDGTEYFVPIPVSKVMITKFGGKKNRIDDTWRSEKMMERKQRLVELGETEE